LHLTLNTFVLSLVSALSVGLWTGMALRRSPSFDPEITFGTLFIYLTKSPDSQLEVWQSSSSWHDLSCFLWSSILSLTIWKPWGNATPCRLASLKEVIRFAAYSLDPKIILRGHTLPELAFPSRIYLQPFNGTLILSPSSSCRETLSSSTRWGTEEDLDSVSPLIIPFKTPFLLLSLL